MEKVTIQYILSVLKRGTITWQGRTDCLNKGRYKVLIGKRMLWARDCDSCGKQHLQKDNGMEVDHISPVGAFDGDFNKFIVRLYCPISNLQALCFSCHKEKTSNDNASIRYKRKKNEFKPTSN